MRVPSGSLLLLLSVGIAACGKSDVQTTAPASVSFVNGALNLGLTGPSPLYGSSAEAINDSAVVVGSAQITIGDPMRAVVWRPPLYQFEFLPDGSGTGSSIATTISNDGTIGGTICESDDFTPPCHPVYWRNGELHQLSGLGEVTDVCPCDGHTMVGYVIVNGLDHGALWVDDVLIDVGAPSGFTSGELVAISHGHIVGNGLTTSLSDAHAEAPYRWSPAAGWVRLGGNVDSFASDVNASGTVVGGENDFWFDGSNSVTTFPGEGLPVAVNDSGVVAGRFRTGDALDYQPGEWTQGTSWVPLGNERHVMVTGINNAGLAVGYASFNALAYALLWRPPAP